MGCSSDLYSAGEVINPPVPFPDLRLQPVHLASMRGLHCSPLLRERIALCTHTVCTNTGFAPSLHRLQCTQRLTMSICSASKAASCSARAASHTSSNMSSIALRKHRYNRWSALELISCDGKRGPDYASQSRPEPASGNEGTPCKQMTGSNGRVASSTRSPVHQQK